MTAQRHTRSERPVGPCGRLVVGSWQLLIVGGRVGEDLVELLVEDCQSVSGPVDALQDVRGEAVCHGQQAVGGAGRVGPRVHTSCLLGAAELVGEVVAQQAVSGCHVVGELGIGVGLAEPGDHGADVDPELGLEGQALGEHRPDNITGIHRPWQGGDTLGDAHAELVADLAQRKAQHLLFGGEVVLHPTSRHPCLGGDVAHGGGVDAVASHYPPQGRGDLVAALVVVDLFGHPRPPFRYAVLHPSGSTFTIQRMESREVATTRHGEITLAYRVVGERAAAPLLLISGNGTQMAHWPPEMVSGLVGRGFRVGMFDNRDAGRSSHCAGLPSYDLRDMAGDALAVLDALGWDRAHLGGVSLGGMIGQVMAVHHQDRVATLTSISSAPGWGMRISRPRLRTLAAIIKLGLRAGKGPEAAAEQAVALFRLLGAPGQTLDEAWLRRAATLAYHVDHDPTAGRRQLTACKISGDRRAELARVTAPTLVIHGEEDPMQSIQAGRATAAAIPGARFLPVPAAGHVFPPQAWPTVLDAIKALAHDCTNQQGATAVSSRQHNRRGQAQDKIQ